MKVLRWLIAVVPLCVSFAAHASEWAQMKNVNPSYMPAGFYFQIDTSTCNLQYTDSNPEKVKAVYATALAALLSGERVYVSYDPQTCVSTGFSLGDPNR